MQPYQERGQILGLEKLFFDFDSKDLSAAWKDTEILTNALTKYYNLTPFITFSGRKGYHVYVFLRNVVQTWPIHRDQFVKKIYRKLQEKILKGLDLETLDPNIIGDIQRLARVPYSTHEKSGKLCDPIGPLDPAYCRRHGLDTNMVEPICKEIIAERKWQKSFSRRKTAVGSYPSSKIRPCTTHALTLPLHTGAGHKMRLAIAAEHLNKGYSVNQTVQLFRSQVDFGDGSKTRYYVQDISKKHYKPLKCKTIQELGYCLDDCPRLHKKRAIAGQRRRFSSKKSNSTVTLQNPLPYF